MGLTPPVECSESLCSGMPPLKALGKLNNKTAKISRERNFPGFSPNKLRPLEE
jgi:hypothetical protein